MDDVTGVHIDGEDGPVRLGRDEFFGGFVERDPRQRKRGLDAEDLVSAVDVENDDHSGDAVRAEDRVAQYETRRIVIPPAGRKVTVLDDGARPELFAGGVVDGDDLLATITHDDEGAMRRSRTGEPEDRVVEVNLDVGGAIEWSDGHVGLILRTDVATAELWIGRPPHAGFGGRTELHDRCRQAVDGDELAVGDSEVEEVIAVDEVAAGFEEPGMRGDDVRRRAGPEGIQHGLLGLGAGLSAVSLERQEHADVGLVGARRGGSADDRGEFGLFGCEFGLVGCSLGSLSITKGQAARNECDHEPSCGRNDEAAQPSFPSLFGIAFGFVGLTGGVNELVVDRAETLGCGQREADGVVEPSASVQIGRLTATLLPRGRRHRDRIDRPEEVGVFAHPLDESRPLSEQRFVGDLDGRFPSRDLAVEREEPSGAEVLGHPGAGRVACEVRDRDASAEVG